MRALKVKGHCRCHDKSNFFTLLKSRSLIVKGCALKLSHPSVRPGFRNFCPLAQLRHSLLRGEGLGGGDGVLSDMAVLGDRTEYPSGLDIIRVIRFFSFGPIRVARFSLDNYEKKVIIFFGLVY